MSVLINMEMPESCDSCPIMQFEDTNCAPELYCGCPIVFKAHPRGEDGRPDYCPLIEMPDVRPVVRCGECKHWKRVRNNCFLASCELDDVVRSEDFFCADGEKREES